MDDDKPFEPETVRFIELIPTFNDTKHNMEKILKEFEGRCYRISLVDDKVCMPIWNQKSSLLINNVKEETALETEIYPRSIKQTSNSEVLAGTCRGLYVLDLKGKVKYKVNDGIIMDVSVWQNNTAVAYSYSSNTVIVCKYEENNKKWEKKSEISLQQTPLRDQDPSPHTLVCWDQSIYIASVKGNKVFKLSMSGDLESVLEIEGVNGDSTFGGPLLSGADSDGNILICDSNKKRILVYEATASQPSWKDFSLSTDHFPADCFLTPDAMYVLYCVDKERRKVVKYFV